MEGSATVIDGFGEVDLGAAAGEGAARESSQKERAGRAST